MEVPCWLVQVKYFMVFSLPFKIQAAATALRNTRGLPLPKNYEHKVNEDLLDWLQAMFGFQERQSKFIFVTV
jgi:hypothetical protein